MMRAKIIALMLLLVVCCYADEGPYFSPHGGVQQKLIDRINHVQTSLDVAIYSLTARNVAQAIIAASRRGVKVRIVMDLSQSKGRSSDYGLLKTAGIPVHTLHGLGRGIMHDKIGIFDDAEVITGSYNWTDNAENNNYENALFLTGDKVKAFEDQFNVLWSKN